MTQIGNKCLFIKLGHTFLGSSFFFFFDYGKILWFGLLDIWQWLTIMTFEKLLHHNNLN